MKKENTCFMLLAKALGCLKGNKTEDVSNAEDYDDSDMNSRDMYDAIFNDGIYDDDEDVYEHALLDDEMMNYWTTKNK